MARGVSRRSASAVTTIVLVVLLFAMGTQAQNGNPAGPQFPNIQLPAHARGGDALAALAPYLQEIAASHGKSVDELRNLLVSDNTLWTDTHGRLYYGCELGTPPANAPGAENAGAIAAAPLPYEQTFLLHSRPSATKVIYLDFDGQTTSGTAWNGGKTIVSAPFDLDANPSTFNTAEMDLIQYVWQRVSEDYAPFDVDVTTQDPGDAGLRKTSSGDLYYGMRVVISPTNWYNTSAGGVAYVGVFNYESSTDVYGTCWAFTEQLANGEKYIAEAVSHEVGHTLGLSHDGLTVCCDPMTGGTGYYSGQGNWAPIMGVGYYKEVTQWSKGEYTNANQTQDDLAVMPLYGISYRADDHGNSISTATPLTGPSFSASGVIETRTDVDVFSFQTGAGTIAFTVNPAPLGPNLDIYVRLYDGTANLVASNDGTGLSASLTATVPAGTYYLAIEGVGSGDPLTTGYSDYASLGQYQIAVSGPNQPPVANASATPTSGNAPLTVGFSSNGSSDPEGGILTHSWNFGDGTTSTAANPSHTYNSPGTYNAVLTVWDNQGAQATSSTVPITPQQDPSKLPDMIVSRLSTSASSAAPGASITVTDTSKNQGLSQAAASTTFIYLSFDATLDAGDTFLGSRSVGMLAPGGSSAVSTGVKIPAITLPGTWYLIVVADGGKGVAESNETNNTRTKSISITGPDLLVSFLSAPSSAAKGSTIIVKDTTKNQGASPAAAFTTNYYLSLDSVYHATDTMIGSRALVSLVNGASNTASVNVTIPPGTAAGTYYLIACADAGDAVAETSETNNIRTAKIVVQ